MAIILEAKAISKKYQQKYVLKDVSLAIHQHEKIGLIGANGSGKTTLSEILAGVRKASNGEVIYQAVKETIFQFLEQNIIINQRAMLLVSHNMEEIERFCDRIIYLSAGKIKSDVAIANVLQEYGSVLNYTKQMFENE